MAPTKTKSRRTRHKRSKLTTTRQRFKRTVKRPVRRTKRTSTKRRARRTSSSTNKSLVCSRGKRRLVFLNAIEIKGAGLKKGDMAGGRKVVIRNQTHYPCYVNKTQMAKVRKLRGRAKVVKRVKGAPKCARAYPFNAHSAAAVALSRSRPGSGRYMQTKGKLIKRTSGNGAAQQYFANKSIPELQKWGEYTRQQKEKKLKRR